MWIHLLSLALISGAGGDASSGGTRADFPGVDLTYSETRTPKWWAKSGQDDAEEAENKSETLTPRQKRRQEEKKLAAAKEKAREVIESVAKDQIQRGSVPKQARFAEVRAQLKPLDVNFNWPALYDRLYDQLLTEAIRSQLVLRDKREDDALAVLLLIEA